MKIGNFELRAAGIYNQSQLDFFAGGCKVPLQLPWGGMGPGDPNLGTPTFAGKSPDPEIPAPMEAAGLVHPRKNSPRGVGPLLEGLANLLKQNPGWLVYNTI